MLFQETILSKSLQVKRRYFPCYYIYEKQDVLTLKTGVNRLTWFLWITSYPIFLAFVSFQGVNIILYTMLVQGEEILHFSFEHSFLYYRLFFTLHQTMGLLIMTESCHLFQPSCRDLTFQYKSPSNEAGRRNDVSYCSLCKLHLPLAFWPDISMILSMLTGPLAVLLDGSERWPLLIEVLLESYAFMVTITDIFRQTKW